MFEGTVKVWNKKDGRCVLPISLSILSGSDGNFKCDELLYHDSEECWANVPVLLDQNNQEYRIFRFVIFDKYIMRPLNSFIMYWQYYKHHVGDSCGYCTWENPTRRIVKFEIRQSTVEFEIQLSETVQMSLLHVSTYGFDNPRVMALLYDMNYIKLQELCNRGVLRVGVDIFNFNITPAFLYKCLSKGIGCKQKMISRIEFYHYTTNLPHTSVSLKTCDDVDDLINELIQLSAQELRLKCLAPNSNDLMFLTHSEWRQCWHGDKMCRRCILRNIATLKKSFINDLLGIRLITLFSKVEKIVLSLWRMPPKMLQKLCSSGGTSPKGFNSIGLSAEEWISCWRTGQASRDTMAFHVSQLVDTK